MAEATILCFGLSMYQPNATSTWRKKREPCNLETVELHTRARNERMEEMKIAGYSLLTATFVVGGVIGFGLGRRYGERPLGEQAQPRDSGFDPAGILEPSKSAEADVAQG
jgi:hypothetical protein